MPDLDYAPGLPPESSDPPPPVRRTLKPRPLLWRLLAEHNPFYLLSAACMLASCLALTNSLSWIPIARTRLLTLVLTINLYEAALLGIAVYLVKSRRLVRDGRMLLLLQAFFVADFSFLNAELATADLATGLLVNAGLLALAAVKLAVVVHFLRPALTAPQFAFVLLELAVLYALPCALAGYNVDPHLVGGRELYVAWWLAAILPAIYEVVSWVDRRRHAGGGVYPVTAGAQAAPVRAWLVLPYLSILTHLGILHYVYDTPWQGAHAAPVLLGLTLVLNRAGPNRLVPRKDLAALRLLLPLAAVLVSGNDPWRFGPTWPYPRLGVSALGLAVAGAYLCYVYCFLQRYAKTFLATGAAAWSFYIFGPSRQHSADAVRATWEWTSRLAGRVVPKSTSDWGVLGLVASFGFLIVGFWVSLTRRPGAGEEEEEVAEAPPRIIGS